MWPVTACVVQDEHGTVAGLALCSVTLFTRDAANAGMTGQVRVCVYVCVCACSGSLLACRASCGASGIAHGLLDVHALLPNAQVYGRLAGRVEQAIGWQAITTPWTLLSSGELQRWVARPGAAGYTSMLPSH